VIEPLTGIAFAQRLDELHHKYDEAVVLSQLNMLSSHDTPRVYTIAKEQVNTVRLLFLCQMTVAGAPNIYYGDEIGMAGNRDPDCRRAFPWHDHSQWNKQLQNDVRQYVALRHALPALRRGDFSIVGSDERAVAYRRHYQGETVLIAFNTSERARKLTLDAPLAEHFRDALLSGEDPLLKGVTSIKLEARSGRVWRNDES
jgi:neopullulanase